MDTDYIRRCTNITKKTITQMCKEIDRLQKIERRFNIMNACFQIKQKERRKSSRRLAA